MRYRKKPIIIEAEQYLGPICVPKGTVIFPIVPSGVTWKAFDMTFDYYPIINTLEGWLNVSPNDWIITGVKGEKYPCKPDIFEATYEKVE